MTLHISEDSTLKSVVEQMVDATQAVDILRKNQKTGPFVLNNICAIFESIKKIIGDPANNCHYIGNQNKYSYRVNVPLLIPDSGGYDGECDRREEQVDKRTIGIYKNEIAIIRQILDEKGYKNELIRGSDNDAKASILVTVLEEPIEVKK